MKYVQNIAEQNYVVMFDLALKGSPKQKDTREECPFALYRKQRWERVSRPTPLFNLSVGGGARKERSDGLAKA